jgi:hypothetical protein
MKPFKYSNKSLAYLGGLTVGALILGFLGLALEAWLLGWILSWFAVYLTFWQNFAIIFLVNAIMSSAKSSK